MRAPAVDGPGRGRAGRGRRRREGDGKWRTHGKARAADATERGVDAGLVGAWRTDVRCGCMRASTVWACAAYSRAMRAIRAGKKGGR